MYVLFQEPTHPDLDNLSHVMITSYQPREPVFIKKVIEVKVILRNGDEVDNDLQICAVEHNYEKYKGKLGLKG